MSASFEETFATIKQLVDMFKASEVCYLSPDYQEADVRIVESNTP